MDMINKAIADAKFTIPREVLRLAYMPRQNWREAPLSLDEQIRRKTIYARVLVDANIVGGQTVDVPLKGVAPISVDDQNYIYEIPSDRLNNRTILSALSVNFINYTSAVGTAGTLGVTNNMMGYASDTMTAARRAMDSRSSIPNIGTAECFVVAHNTVLVRNVMRSASVESIRCLLTNEENLANISFKAALDFSTLCRYAIKSFIYNELLIKLDKGHLEAGIELSSIKSYVDSCSDAEENYQTFLQEEWGDVATMSNRIAYTDLIKMQLDPGI